MLLEKAEEECRKNIHKKLDLSVDYISQDNGPHTKFL